MNQKIDFMRISMNVQKNLIEAAADEENVEDEEQSAQTTKRSVKNPSS